MEGSCSTGRSPPWAVVPVEEEEELHNRALAPNQVTKDLSNSRDRDRTLLGSSPQTSWIGMIAYDSGQCSAYLPYAEQVVGFYYKNMSRCTVL
jgi:hypothetical protein